jgi:hypothetical protein
MKNNMLSKEGSESLVQRIQNLRADTPPLWGSMTATEMLLHCNKVHEHLLSPAEASGKGTSVKQFLVRWVVLYMLPRYPKGASAPKQLRTKGAISEAAFEGQKQTFIDLIRRFQQIKTPIQHHHPYFGNLSTEQWGLASWKHTDHHLRQFGL